MSRAVISLEAVREHRGAAERCEAAALTLDPPHRDALLAFAQTMRTRAKEIAAGKRKWPSDDRSAA